MSGTMESRRTFLGTAAIAGSAVLAAAEPSAPAKSNRLRVLCVGGHPDDPESACAGVLSLYADRGHAVTILYLTRGERGIRGASLDEAAKIRTAEAEAACRIIGAKPMFFGQIDGATEVNKGHVDAMERIFAEVKPDVVFTHWPVDRHIDHQVAGLLAQRAWLAGGCKAALLFFEVNTGAQSRLFHPTTYVDVSKVLARKKAALLAHVSQKGDEVWTEHHGPIAQWRGRELGVEAAEAFIHVNSGLGHPRPPGLEA
jgi:LmbE family N-acetylglucosaminyl deacetylase